MKRGNNHQKAKVSNNLKEYKGRRGQITKVTDPKAIIKRFVV